MENTSQKSNELPKIKFDFEAHLKRNAAAWSARQVWTTIYNDAFKWALPQRADAMNGTVSPNASAHIYNSISTTTYMALGASMYKNMFPPETDLISLEPSVFYKNAKKGKEEELDPLKDQLADISSVILPFFRTAEFAGATKEMCHDLVVGTAAIMVCRGNRTNPIRFVSLPIEEIAIENGPYNDVVAVFWKRQMTHRQVKENFPDANFPQDFQDKLRSDPECKLEIHQDFVQVEVDGATLWEFVAHLGDKHKSPLVRRTRRTRPVAVPRMMRMPSQPYGIGPLILALPTIKTLNAAEAMILKSAAFQMLGMWAARINGAINPETVKLVPGGIIPMQSTGGVMGADLVQINTSTTPIKVGELITENKHRQISDIMHDNQLPVRGDTPMSASEVHARSAQNDNSHVAALGDAVNDVMPVLVKAAIEIAYEEGLVETVYPLNDFLVKINVLSPIATSLRMRAASTVVEYMQLVGALRGQEALNLLMDVDQAISDLGLKMGVPEEYMFSKAERDKKLAELQAQMEQAMQAQAMQAQAAQAPQAQAAPADANQTGALYA